MDQIFSNSKKKDSIKKALGVFFKNHESGYTFSPSGLKAECCAILDGYEFKYIDTFMRIARMYYRNKYRCISRSRSIYEII